MLCVFQSMQENGKHIIPFCFSTLLGYWVTAVRRGFTPYIVCLNSARLARCMCVGFLCVPGVLVLLGRIPLGTLVIINK